ncbi:MAG TPA: YceI family protein [Labilithrix sp.]|nr:YceI family protein [Labilithrix sp.]
MNTPTASTKTSRTLGIARVGSLAIAALALVALTGCDDPAKGKAKATTGEATSVESKALSPSSVSYEFNQATSKVEWVGSKVTGKHEGGFKTFAGRVSLVDKAPEKSSVTVEIDTDSLYSDSDKLVSHLKTADFFDVAQFPKASFASTEVKAGGERGASQTVTGNLTLHGVTKSITFPATIKVNPGGVDVDAEFSINRKDFGLVYAGKPDDLIRDDVVIKLTIRAQNKS